MRVALYARYSSEHQKESSMEDQNRNCETRAQREGWVVTARYADRAISGTTSDRPDYQRMLVDAKAKHFDVLLVDDFSRLSRDSVETEQTRRRLVHWGVRLIGVSDGIDTNTKNHEMLSGFKDIMNAQFVSELRDKIARGMTGKALRGYHLDGRTYGYKLVPELDPTRKDPYGNPERVGTKLAIDEDQAKWVRQIFEWYAEGQSPHKIVTELNRRQVPAPGAAYRRKSGRTPSWSAASLQGDATLGTGLLNNLLYTGRVVWNRKRRDKDPDTGGRAHIARDKKEWIETEAPHLRIIDEALWARVTAARAVVSRGVYDLRKLHSRARSTGRNPKYLFSGLLVCGMCGGKFVVCATATYCCSTWRTRGATVCANALRVPRKLAESALLAAIQKDLFTPEGLEVFKAEIIRLLASQRRTRRPDVVKATARLQDVEREIAHIITAIKARVFLGSTKAELDRFEAEQATLTQTIAGRNKLFDKVVTFLPDMEQRFKQLVDNLATVTQQQVDKARGILRDLVGGQIPLHATADGAERYLTAEVSGDYSGLLKLALGSKLISTPVMWSKFLRVWVVILSLIAAGCSSSPVGIPETLELHIDKNLTFTEVLASPESYKGRLILLGGEVLKAKRLKEGTRVELLQLPLNNDQEPTIDLTQSQGRVLVLHQEFLDPATLMPGMLVTFVGEVSGAIVEKMDEVEYRYPTLTVKHWHVWTPATFDDRRGAPSFGVFGGMGVGGGSRGGGGFGIGF
jgi:Slp family outer membrane lipoprotein